MKGAHKGGSLTLLVDFINFLEVSEISQPTKKTEYNQKPNLKLNHALLHLTTSNLNS
jgi:hypothetical protein